MLESIGWGTFIFFAAFAAVSGVWTLFFVPETKDKTLEQLDREFNDHTGQKDEERRQRHLHILASEITAGEITADPTLGSGSDVSGKNREEQVEHA